MVTEYNVQPGITQPLPNIIWYSNAEKLSYADYLAIFALFYYHMWLGLMRSWVNIATLFGWYPYSGVDFASYS